MTTTACLPECERNCWTGQDKHAFGCPVAAMFGAAEQAYFGPRAPQAEDGGKVEECVCGHREGLHDRFGCEFQVQTPFGGEGCNCQRFMPKPAPAPELPEAPKVEEKCATCRREEVWHRGSMHGFRKPAPKPPEAPKACLDVSDHREHPLKMVPAGEVEPVTEAEADKSTLRILRARLVEVEGERDKAQGIIMGTTAEARVTLGVNLRRYWSAEDQAMLGRMLFDEDVPKLLADLAAAKEEVAENGALCVKLAAEKARADKAEEIILLCGLPGWEGRLISARKGILATRARQEQKEGSRG